ncbi:MAG: hypothetical protein KDB54_08315 [Solirubrobacterales bacterium]|nr:hypothetical protein [Solirubrobacterales bacterium]HRV60531.1 hypothetical protein [Solirubrobacterales bacterium]
MPGRKSALWLAAAISVLTFTTAGLASAATRERPCNGSVELCSRTLDQVVLPGTHNSMSNEEYGWAIPNQHYSIPTQLGYGVRAFLIDTHYGKPSPGTGVSGVANWKGSDGDPHTNNAGVYLCHVFCTLGASDLTTELGKIANFLASHPREVLVFQVENYVDPEDIASSVSDSGLIDYVYTGSTDQYPTLGEMIAENQRVVMFSEGNTGSVPWFHDSYAGAMQETPYDFRRNEANVPLSTQGGIDLLTNPATLDSTCRPHRGGTTGSIFLMNHWVNGNIDDGPDGTLDVTPDPAVAQILNQPDVLIARAEACKARRGKLPNIVAVDDFGEGDLTDAVRQLNGVKAKPFFEVTRPRKATVKAGRKATYKIAIRNWGDGESALTRVCASVPKKLAVKPKCVSAYVSQGNPGKGTAILKISTRRIIQGRFKGSKSGQVRFTISGGGDSISTTAALKVKPLKKKKPKRKRH